MIHAIFFLSGVSALIFQHIWFRQAGLVFGNSVWASSLVLSSFMAGLALGNGLAARSKASRGMPLRFYAGLEFVVAITGVSLVFILPALGEELIPYLGAIAEGGASLGLVRFIVAFALMVVPTAAMGMTLPVLVGRTPSRELFGTTLGRLYGWNTLGAVVGALLGEAFLYERIGIRNTAFVAGATNLCAGLLSLGLARLEPPAASPAEPARRRLREGEVRLLLVAALAGGSLLALEVVWTRFLQLSVFGTALTFAIMLATVLAGMGIGSILASRSPVLCGAPPAVAVLAMLSALAVTGSYSAFADVLSVNFASWPGAPWTRVGALSAALILPTAALSGAFFNAVGTALARTQSAARATGLLTLANTLGAMAGAMVAGFVLLPRLGMEQSFRVLAIVYTVAAVISPGFVKLLRESRTLMAVTASSLVFTLLFPKGLMERTYLRLPGQTTYAALGVESRVIGFREGLTETIRYVDTSYQGERLHTRLMTNAFSMSGTTFLGRRYMETFVYLPVAIHPRIRRALLISYGVGMTAFALAETKEIERIDVVNISKDILEMAPFAVPPGVRAPLSDPRVVTHIEDGRFFLLTVKQGYDLITSEPPPPHLGGVVNLYTREYFDLLRERLNPGGIVSYWLPIASLSDEDARAISSAFCAAFADCTLWQGMNLDWILIGTRDLQGPVSLERFSRQWAGDGPRDLADIGLEIPEQLGALFMAEGRSFSDLRSAAPLEDNYPGRLSRAPPALSFGPWRRQLMDPVESRKRFLESAFVRRVWPETMLRDTLPYFAVQGHYVGMMRDIVPGNGDVTNFADAVRILRETPLEVLPSILLGTTGDIRILINRLEHGGGAQKNWQHAHLAVRDLAARRYADAIGHFRRALLANPSAPGVRERLILALCLDGQRSEAAAERRTLGPSAIDEWTEAFDLACVPNPPKT